MCAQKSGQVGRFLGRDVVIRILCTPGCLSQVEVHIPRDVAGETVTCFCLVLWDPDCVKPRCRDQSALPRAMAEVRG